MNTTLIAALTSIGLALPASALTTVYTDRAAFAAAAGVTSTIDFNNLAGPGSFFNYNGGALRASGVRFTSNATLFAVGAGWYGTNYADGAYLATAFASTDILRATLPLVTAVGFDFGSLFGSGTTANILLSDGTTVSAISAGSIRPLADFGFIGFTSSIPLTSIEIALPDAPDYSAIDNFTFSRTGVAPVSEPAAIALAGGGLALIALSRRRRSV